MEVEVYESRMLFTAYKNTWSNQRKKRRLEKVHAKVEDRELTKMIGEQTESARIGAKRKANESEDILEAKVVKVDSPEMEEDECLIEFLVEVKRGSEIEKKEFGKALKEDGTYLRFEAIETINKEFLHQIMQFVKNNMTIQ